MTESNPLVTKDLYPNHTCHSDAGTCFDCYCPVCGDKLYLATNSWGPPATCSCPRTWGLVLEAHGWLDGENY